MKTPPRPTTARGSGSKAAVLVLCAAGLVLPLALAERAHAAQAPVPLGNAATFGALSAAAMTNSGLATVVNGNVGSSTSIDVAVTHPGFAAYGAGAPELANAQASLLTAYGNAEAQAPTGNITGVNLAGQALGPGVYNSTGGILISGPTPLTLNGGGNADAVFIFQAAAAGDLTVDPTSSIVFTNGAQPCNVFWKVQSAFLKNTGFKFVGTILALTQITLTDNITVEGRLLARNADVAFVHDVVNMPTTCVTQASVDAAAAAAAAAATAAANAAAAAQAAAEKAAADAAAAAQAVEDAKVAAAAKVVAEKAAADAAAAAKVAAQAAAAADLVTAQAAARKAAAAATLAAKKAKVAKAAALRTAAAARVARARAAKARIAKARATATTSRTIARPAQRHAGFTG